MSTVGHIAAQLFRKAVGRDRLIVAIAGPPGAGKSSLAQALAEALAAGGQETTIVAMDGFHFDDRLLAARGQLARKGAPGTFDLAGLAFALARIKNREDDVAVPVFDRSVELSRAAAAVVPRSTRIVLVEGNYLLLDEPLWRDLAPLIDVSLYLDVDEAELERRLVQRWLDHGFDEAEARRRTTSNDLPNARLVRERRRAADITL